MDINFGLIDEMASKDWVYHLNSLEPFPARRFKEVASAFRTAFPDLNNTIDEQIVEGNVVVSRGTSRGTQRGPLGTIPATGKSVSVPWMILTRFDNGRIVEDREIYDELALMQQIGVIPETD